MKLTRILSIAAICGMAIVATGCGGDKAKDDTGVVTLEEAEKQFASELGRADTTEVLEMGRAFMESVKNGQVEEAIDMLWMRDTTATPRKLTDDERASVRSRFEQFPVVSYTVAQYDFSIPSLNDLKYSYVYNPNIPNGKMGLMFNPMKVDGKWYLMLKQADQPAKDAKNALPPSAGIKM